MSVKGSIAEVFSSVQGEGLYIGFRQVFIRLAGCGLGCPYCDTDYKAVSKINFGDIVLDNPIDPRLLADKIVEVWNPHNIHSYSFTGGEPLLQADFLKECVGYLKEISSRKMFLETSGLILDDLASFDGLFDIMSIDIKTHSENVVSNLPKLLKVVTDLKKSEYYLKLLMDYDFNELIFDNIFRQLKEFSIKNLIIQPVDNKINSTVIDKLYDKCYSMGIEIRIIPQSHKLLEIR